MVQTQNICDAFHAGGEPWEAIDALIRIENRIWSTVVDMPGGDQFEKAYFDAYDIVRHLRIEIENQSEPLDE